jgi:leader peptidase (prepilin peptidase)/N-methyltransferase
LGSFINVLVYRLPKGISIVKPSSYCPICRSKIKFYDNIPVISFILLRGKCRNCGHNISIQYPIVELTFAIVLMLLIIKFGLNKDFLYYTIFSFFLIAASFCDIFTLLDDKFETGIIPDSLNYTGILVGFTLSSILYDNYIGSLIGTLVGFLLLYIPNMIYKIFRKVDGIGGGDMKLLALVGAFLGFKLILFVLFISSLFGAIVGIIIVMITKNRNFPIPFGPFIALGSLFVLFYRNNLLALFNLKII